MTEQITATQEKETAAQERAFRVWCGVKKQDAV